MKSESEQLQYEDAARRHVKRLIRSRGITIDRAVDLTTIAGWKYTGLPKWLRSKNKVSLARYLFLVETLE